jgi:ABC-type sugar transport system permease subunit
MLAIPIILYEGFFILVPMIQQFISSFTSDVIGFGAVKFVGLANYDRMWQDARFWNSLRVTFTFMVATVIVAVGLGLLAAILMNQKFLNTNHR